MPRRFGPAQVSSESGGRDQWCPAPCTAHGRPPGHRIYKRQYQTYCCGQYALREKARLDFFFSYLSPDCISCSYFLLEFFLFVCFLFHQAMNSLVTYFYSTPQKETLRRCKTQDHYSQEACSPLPGETQLVFILVLSKY